MFKKNDFIEIDFTASIKETNHIFETTSEEVAKKNNFYNPKQKYKPRIICLGSNQLLPGLEKQLENKEIGKEYEIELSPENAFGKKNPKLLQLVSMSSFKRQKINPYPRMQVNIDNLIGVVRTVSGGRVIVDFNHPLSGKNIIYKIKILRLVNNVKEKISSIISQFTQKSEVEVKESEAIVKTDLPEPIKKELPALITKLIPLIKKVSFSKYIE